MARRRRVRSEVMVKVLGERDNRIVRLVTGERAATLIAQGAASLVYRQDGVTVAGIRLRCSARLARQAEVKPRTLSLHDPSARNECVLLPHEMEAVAGVYGPSRTRGLSDWQREQREKDGLDGEDFVERAQQKFERGFVPAGRAVVAA